MNIIKALMNIRPGAMWDLEGTTYEGLVWKDDSPKPTKKEVDDELLRLVDEYKKTEYQRSRKTEYPNIEEQLDMLYWDKINGTDNWVSSIQKIKQKYPKNS
jgi:hypothetical protein